MGPVDVEAGRESRLDPDPRHAQDVALQGESVGQCRQVGQCLPPFDEGTRRQAGDGDRWVELMASGSILFEAFRAQEILEQRYGVSSRLWSATSWTLLARDAMQAERWSRLHGDAEPRRPYLHAAMGEPKGPVLAVSDWVRAVPGQIRPWLPSDTLVLGTDGFGRSDVRVDLRRFFEISAEHIVAGALYQLARRGRFDRDKLTEAMADLKIETDGPAPWTV